MKHKKEDTAVGAMQRAPVQMLNVERARELLAASKSFDEVKCVRDRAEAVRVYQRHIGAAIEAQQDAAEIAVRAMRRMGELLAELPKNEGGRPVGEAGCRRQPASTPTLAELGIKKSDAYRAQRLAAVPEERLDAYISECREKKRPLTRAGALRCGEEKPAHRASREHANEDLVAAVPSGRAADEADGKPPPEPRPWDAKPTTAPTSFQLKAIERDAQNTLIDRVDSSEWEKVAKRHALHLVQIVHFLCTVKPGMDDLLSDQGV